LELYSAQLTSIAIKLSRVEVQTFSFGRNWSKWEWDGASKSEDLDSNAVKPET